METLKIKRSDISPEMVLDHKQKSFYIEGVSRPEDVRELFLPVVKWMKAYQEYLCSLEDEYYSEDEPMIFKFDLEYFNSSTAKFLYDIIIAIRRLKECNINVEIAWIYYEEDTDMKEAGEDLAILADLEFAYISKQ